MEFHDQDWSLEFHGFSTEFQAQNSGLKKSGNPMAESLAEFQALDYSSPYWSMKLKD